MEREKKKNKKNVFFCVCVFFFKVCCQKESFDHRGVCVFLCACINHLIFPLAPTGIRGVSPSRQAGQVGFLAGGREGRATGKVGGS